MSDEFAQRTQSAFVNLAKIAGKMLGEEHDCYAADAWYDLLAERKAVAIKSEAMPFYVNHDPDQSGVTTFWEIANAGELSQQLATELANDTPLQQPPSMTMRTFWAAAWSVYKPLGQPGHDTLAAVKWWREHDAEFRKVDWRRHLSAESTDRLLAAVGAMRESMELIAFDSRRPVERRTSIRDFNPELDTLLETSRMVDGNFAELASGGWTDALAPELVDSQKPSRNRMLKGEAEIIARGKWDELWPIDNASEWGRRIGCSDGLVKKLLTWADAEAKRMERLNMSMRLPRNANAGILEACATSDPSKFPI